MTPTRKNAAFTLCCFQNVENLRRPFRIGAIIKRDRDLMLAARALMIERRELRELYDSSPSDNHHCPPPAAPPVGAALIHGNDFAFADIGDRIGSFQNLERVCASLRPT